MTTSLLRRAALLLVLQSLGSTWAMAADDFLPPEQAFRFEARMLAGNQVEVVFNVADGYYLYHERFAFAAAPAQTKLGTPVLPAGKVKYDQTFGRALETHRGRVVIRLPIDTVASSTTLTVTSQGCADAGLCYAPMQSTARLTRPAAPRASAAR